MAESVRSEDERVLGVIAAIVVFIGSVTFLVMCLVGANKLEKVEDLAHQLVDEEGYSVVVDGVGTEQLPAELAGYYDVDIDAELKMVFCSTIDRSLLYGYINRDFNSLIWLASVCFD